MNAPDFSHGYLRIPHAVWREVFCQAALTRRELQLVAVVIRESWGWQGPRRDVYLWSRVLTMHQFSRATGIAPAHVTTLLKRLVARGVLLQRGRSFQFVPDPRRWITHRQRLPERDDRAPKRERNDPEMVAPTSVAKKTKKEKRNVARPSWKRLSTAVDKSHGLDAATAAWLRTHLADLLESLLGPPTPETAQALQTWVEREGLVAVWAILTTALRRPPGEARATLAEHLRQNDAAPTIREGRTG